MCYVLRTRGDLNAFPPLAARKPAKMSLGGTSGPRVCARICKLAGRRQRMLLRLLVSVAVAFCFLFSSLVSKGGGCLASCSSSNLRLFQSLDFAVLFPCRAIM